MFRNLKANNEGGGKKSSPTIVTLHCHSRNIRGFGEANDELLWE